MTTSRVTTFVMSKLQASGFRKITFHSYREKGCFCWVKRPEPCEPDNPTCRVVYGGRCYVTPPPGLVPTGFRCDL